MSDLMHALTELRCARDDYERACAYYEGEAAERFPSALMQQLFGTTGDDDFKVNLACRPVDAVADRLEIAAITCTPDEDTETFSRLVWEANDLDLEAPQIQLKALMYGDAYLFVWEAESEANDVAEADEAPEGSQPEPQQGVDAFYNSPLVARIVYDDEHPRRKKLAIKSWCEGSGEDERIRVNLYYPDRIEKYITKPKTKGDKDADFEAYVDEHTDDTGVMDNPYDQIPFFHFRTASQYGRPEHKNAYGPQDALTKLIKNQMASSDFDAFPQRYGLVEAGASTDDDIDWGEDDETDPEDKSSSLVSRSGSFWALRNYKAVGQFNPADVENFLKPMGVYVRFMAATTSTPLRWFDPSGDVPSGESIRADEAPLNKKVLARAKSFGATWAEAGAFAMKVLGRPGVKVTVRWKSPQTIEDLDFWEMVLAKQDAGVPVRNTLLEAGYSEIQVTEWGYTEENPNGPGRLDAMLAAAGGGEAA